MAGDIKVSVNNELLMHDLKFKGFLLKSVVFYTASHLSPRHLYTVSEPDGHGILTVDPTLDGEFSEDKLLSTSSLDIKLDLL